MDHNILLEKLDYHGIRDVARDWFQSYLDKQNRMPLSMDLIHVKPIQTNVSQGSALESLLFLVNINNLYIYIYIYIYVLIILKPITLLMTPICFSHIVH